MNNSRSIVRFPLFFLYSLLLLLLLQTTNGWQQQTPFCSNKYNNYRASIIGTTTVKKTPTTLFSKKEEENEDDDSFLLHTTTTNTNNRRKLLMTSASAVAALVLSSSSSSSNAAMVNNNENLTAQYYNADGSLKEESYTVLKEKVVSSTWDIQDEGVVQVDGILLGSSVVADEDKKSGAATTTVSYQIPGKWISTSTDQYVDPSEGLNAKAADHIYVYQAPGIFTKKQLENASMKGVGKTLKVMKSLDKIRNADLVSGKKNNDKLEGGLYYEFDLAWAPSKCDDDNNASLTSNNLGLGFCPYESVYLMSATLTDEGRLYVMTIEANQKEWKQANAELKRIRNSFVVQST